MSSFAANWSSAPRRLTNFPSWMSRVRISCPAPNSAALWNVAEPGLAQVCSLWTHERCEAERRRGGVWLHDSRASESRV